MDINTEGGLLLNCLGDGDDRERVAGIERMSPSDWDAVVQESGRHCLAPLLYHRLKTLEKGKNIPAEVEQKLQKSYLNNSLRNTRRYHELTRALGILHGENIPVIVLKGAHLAGVVYANPALRTMGDIDLLFKKEDFARGQRKLLEAGFFSQEGNPLFDLHYKIDHSFEYLDTDMDGVWKRAQPALIAGVEVLVLSPEDLLLHLCVHLSFHHQFQYRALRSLCDIQETVKYYQTQMEWEQVVCRTREWGVSKAVSLSLFLARDMMGARVPEDVIEGLNAEGFDPQLMAWAVDKIIHGPDDTAEISSLFWRSLKTGGFRERALSFLKLLFPPQEFISHVYNTPLGSTWNYLYYFVRLKDNLVRYTSTLLQILIRNKDMKRQVKRQNRNTMFRAWLSSD